MMHLSQQLKLLQKLTPQQIQYLKLLQLPTLSLEQMIKTELEVNPLLEEGVEDEATVEEAPEDPITSTEEIEQEKTKKDDEFSFEDFLNDEESYIPKGENRTTDDDDRDDFPIAASTPLAEKLIEQLHLADITEVGMQVAEEIIGNVDEDGYLRRDLESIVNDINLSHHLHLSVSQVEEVLAIIQRLDPPGIGSRSLQECLLIQLEFAKADPGIMALARTLLMEHFDEFIKKHYQQIAKLLNISLDDVKKVLDLIGHLNPKPGEGTVINTYR